MSEARPGLHKPGDSEPWCGHSSLALGSVLFTTRSSCRATQIQEHPCLDCAPERVPLNRGSCSWGSGQQASHGDGSEMESDRPCVGPHPIGLQGQVMPSFRRKSLESAMA